MVNIGSANIEEPHEPVSDQAESRDHKCVNGRQWFELRNQQRHLGPPSEIARPVCTFRGKNRCQSSNDPFILFSRVVAQR